MTLALAHLSDPHLPPEFDPPLHRLTGKRLLAWIGWQRKRRALHPSQPLRALLADLNSQAPDAVAVTGDLTNFALPEEFSTAAAFLARLGPPERVVAIPGNHDALVRLDPNPALRAWAPWMGPEFPFLRRIGPLALIGLSTAVPTPPGMASGRLHGEQVETLAALLPALRAEGLCRVLLIHHPPLRLHGGWRKALHDPGPLRALLAREGVELVLHGHHHRATLNPLPGPAGPIPVIGVPLALAARPKPELARWNLYRFSPAEAGWWLDCEARGYDPLSEAFVRSGQWRLLLPR